MGINIDYKVYLEYRDVFPKIMHIDNTMNIKITYKLYLEYDKTISKVKVELICLEFTLKDYEHRLIILWV